MNSAQQKERFLEFSANGADIYAQLSSKYGQNITSLDQITTDYNWLDAVTQVGVTNDFNLSFSKSSDGSKNYVNVGYYREEGTLKGYKLDRFTARLNNESKLNSWLTVSPKLNFIYDKIFNQEYDLFQGFIRCHGITLLMLMENLKMLSEIKILDGSVVTEPIFCRQTTLLW